MSTQEKRKAGGNAKGAAQARAVLQEYIKKGKEARESVVDSETDVESDNDDVELTVEDLEMLSAEDAYASGNISKSNNGPSEEKVPRRKPEPDYEQMSKSIMSLTEMVNKLQSSAIKPMEAKTIVKEKTYKQIQDENMRQKLMASFFQ